MGILSVGLKIVCTFSAILLTIIFVRTISFSKPSPVLKCSENELDFLRASPQVLSRFSKALTIPTVSYEVGVFSEQALLDFHQHIFNSFPTIHSSPLIEKEIVNTFSLLYKVKGRNKKLKPYLLAYHMDVVPAENSTWTYHPFEGKIVDGMIYGRGAIDNKGCLMAFLEALEHTLARGIVPERSFYFSFGHDEEVEGIYGAQEVTRILKSRNLDFEFIFDEGVGVISDSFSYIQPPIAMIGTTEKGFLSIELRVSLEKSGHSSIPTVSSAIGILARAVDRLESNPHPSRLGSGAEMAFFEHIAPYASLPYKVFLSNLWLFGPILSKYAKHMPYVNALIRTTTAPTIIKGGFKDNVLPKEAMAFINHRVHPADTIEDVIAYDRMVINDDRVKIHVVTSHEPHPISDFGDEAVGFQVISLTLRQIYDDVVPAPGMMFANTDCKWYKDLSDNVYRFMPFNLKLSQWNRVHGEDEHISIKAYQDIINFYFHFMRNMDTDIRESLAKAKRQEL